MATPRARGLTIDDGPTALYAGWLVKRPFKSSFGGMKRRWMVLQADSLQWWDGRHGKVLGELPLSAASVVTSYGAKGGTFLKVVTGAQELVLSGTTVEVAGWSQAVSQALVRLRMQMQGRGRAASSTRSPVAPPPSFAPDDALEDSLSSTSTSSPQVGSMTIKERRANFEQPPAPPPAPTPPPVLTPPSAPMPVPRAHVPSPKSSSPPMPKPPLPIRSPSPPPPKPAPRPPHSNSPTIPRPPPAAVPTATERRVPPSYTSSSAYRGGSPHDAPNELSSRSSVGDMSDSEVDGDGHGSMSSSEEASPGRPAPTRRTIKLIPPPRALPLSAQVTSLFGGVASAIVWCLVALTVSAASAAVTHSEWLSAIELLSSDRITATAEVVALSPLPLHYQMRLGWSQADALDGALPSNMDISYHVVAIHYVYRGPPPLNRSHAAVAYATLGHEDHASLSAHAALHPITALSAAAPTVASHLPRVGDSVQMQYLRSDSSICRLHGYRSRVLPADVALWWALPAVLSLLLLARRLLVGLREIRLLRHGRLTYAVLAHQQLIVPRAICRKCCACIMPSTKHKALLGGGNGDGSRLSRDSTHSSSANGDKGANGNGPSSSTTSWLRRLIIGRERWILTFEFMAETTADDYLLRAEYFRERIPGPTKRTEARPVAAAPPPILPIEVNGRSNGQSTPSRGNGNSPVSLLRWMRETVRGGDTSWSPVHSVLLKINDEESLARVTDEAWEPVLYLPSDPAVALLMDSLPPSVTVDAATGSFVSTSWTQELLPPVLALLILALTVQLGL